MKHFLRPTLTAVAMAVALGMTAGVAAQTAGAAGTVDKAKASYVVGWEIASQVPPIMRDELDPNAVAKGDAFLAKNKTAPGVKTTASGLQYQVISQGTGARPGPNDTVEINYTGTFVDGQVFDASAKHNPPGAAKIPLAGVIPGFREGLQLMQVGGHYKLFIPAALAYGAEPQPPMPPNATLIFDVTLVKTGPTPAGAAPAGK